MIWRVPEICCEAYLNLWHTHRSLILPLLTMLRASVGRGWEVGRLRLEGRWVGKLLGQKCIRLISLSGLHKSVGPCSKKGDRNNWPFSNENKYLPHISSNYCLVLPIVESNVIFGIKFLISTVSFPLALVSSESPACLEGLQSSKSFSPFTSYVPFDKDLIENTYIHYSYSWSSFLLCFFLLPQ